MRTRFADAAQHADAFFAIRAISNRNYIISKVRFPQRALASNYISQILIFQYLHLPEIKYLAKITFLFGNDNEFSNAGNTANRIK